MESIDSADNPYDLGEWEADANCRGEDTNIFFGGLEDATDETGTDRKVEIENYKRQAVAICLRCIVRTECLEYAMQTEQPYGVWGGKTEAERRRLKFAKLHAVNRRTEVLSQLDLQN